MPELKIDPEFEQLIPPLTAAERRALRESIVASGGALDPIKVWRGVILDGHNRYRICTELGLPFKTQRVKLKDHAAARAWMLAHQAARRSLTRDQLLVLHLVRGVEPPAGSTPLEIDAARAGIAAGYADDVISGRLSMRQVRNRMRPKIPKAPALGMPPGHELAKQTHQIGPDGETRNTWNKSRAELSQEPAIDLEQQGYHVKGGTIQYSGDGTVPNTWVRFDQNALKREQDMFAAWERHAALYAGIAGTVPAPKLSADASELVTLYPLGDPHIGMLAWEPETGAHFDLKIATRELLACAKIMIDGALPSREGVIINLGDYFHAQDNDQRTPGHGHKLDVDGRHDKVVDAGYALMRAMIDHALTKHVTVRVFNIPGNHDPAEAAGIARWLRAIYEQEPRVIVEDAYAQHQYLRFGRNLFGFHHGHGTAGAALPGVMAEDRAADWGETEHRFWHLGHVHHKSRDKEYGTCIVETHNTLAGKDAWHAGKGYRARQQLQVIQYHREFGEYTRQTVNLARVHAALAKDGER